VTYRIRFEGAALVQLRGLAPAGFDALLGRVVELVHAPWDAIVMPGSDDPAYRQAVFGSWGVLTFHVDDDTELIRIFDLLWAG